MVTCLQPFKNKEFKMSTKKVIRIIIFVGLFYGLQTLGTHVRSIQAEHHDKMFGSGQIPTSERSNYVY